MMTKNNADIALKNAQQQQQQPHVPTVLTDNTNLKTPTAENKNSRRNSSNSDRNDTSFSFSGALASLLSIFNRNNARTDVFLSEKIRIIIVGIVPLFCLLILGIIFLAFEADFLVILHQKSKYHERLPDLALLATRIREESIVRTIGFLDGEEATVFSQIAGSLSSTTTSARNKWNKNLLLGASSVAEASRITNSQRLQRVQIASEATQSALDRFLSVGIDDDDDNHEKKSGNKGTCIITFRSREVKDIINAYEAYKEAANNIAVIIETGIAPVEEDGGGSDVPATTTEFASSTLLPGTSPSPSPTSTTPRPAVTPPITPSSTRNEKALFALSSRTVNRFGEEVTTRPPNTAINRATALLTAELDLISSCLRAAIHRLHDNALPQFKASIEFYLSQSLSNAHAAMATRLMDMVNPQGASKITSATTTNNSLSSPRGLNGLGIATQAYKELDLFAQSIFNFERGETNGDDGMMNGRTVDVSQNSLLDHILFLGKPLMNNNPSQGGSSGRHADGETPPSSDMSVLKWSQVFLANAFDIRFATSVETASTPDYAAVQQGRQSAYDPTLAELKDLTNFLEVEMNKPKSDDDKKKAVKNTIFVSVAIAVTLVSIGFQLVLLLGFLRRTEGARRILQAFGDFETNKTIVSLYQPILTGLLLDVRRIVLNSRVENRADARNKLAKKKKSALGSSSSSNKIDDDDDDEMDELSMSLPEPRNEIEHIYYSCAKWLVCYVRPYIPQVLFGAGNVVAAAGAGGGGNHAHHYHYHQTPPPSANIQQQNYYQRSNTAALSARMAPFNNPLTTFQRHQNGLSGSDSTNAAAGCDEVSGVQQHRTIDISSAQSSAGVQTNKSGSRKTKGLATKGAVKKNKNGGGVNKNAALSSDDDADNDVQKNNSLNVEGSPHRDLISSGVDTEDKYQQLLSHLPYPAIASLPAHFETSSPITTDVTIVTIRIKNSVIQCRSDVIEDVKTFCYKKGGGSGGEEGGDAVTTTATTQQQSKQQQQQNPVSPERRNQSASAPAGGDTTRQNGITDAEAFVLSELTLGKTSAALHIISLIVSCFGGVVHSIEDGGECVTCLFGLPHQQHNANGHQISPSHAALAASTAIAKKFSELAIAALEEELRDRAARREMRFQNGADSAAVGGVDRDDDSDGYDYIAAATTAAQSGNLLNNVLVDPPLPPRHSPISVSIAVTSGTAIIANARVADQRKHVIIIGAHIPLGKAMGKLIDLYRSHSAGVASSTASHFSPNTRKPLVVASSRSEYSSEIFVDEETFSEVPRNLQQRTCKPIAIIANPFVSATSNSNNNGTSLTSPLAIATAAASNQQQPISNMSENKNANSSRNANNGGDNNAQSYRQQQHETTTHTTAHQFRYNSTAATPAVVSESLNLMDDRHNPMYAQNLQRQFERQNASVFDNSQRTVIYVYNEDTLASIGGSLTNDEKVEGGQASNSNANNNNATAIASPAQQWKLYNEAFSSYRSGDVHLALDKFRRYLAAFPNDAHARWMCEVVLQNHLRRRLQYYGTN